MLGAVARNVSIETKLGRILDQKCGSCPTRARDDDVVISCFLHSGSSCLMISIARGERRSVYLAAIFFRRLVAEMFSVNLVERDPFDHVTDVAAIEHVSDVREGPDAQIDRQIRAGRVRCGI